ncbi:putative protein TPRXL [Anopheles nili]|uniref:putative protein TPRXL n=1 Tax=Anopheles nili TaxID=185578 RepID=UPI00237B34E7|nr:putative protein TPRXL [Anopheles nili]
MAVTVHMYKSPESLVRYRLLSEPEIVNLLSSTPSGGSEVSEHREEQPLPGQHPPPNRCSGNSFDASCSSASGSPSGVENNGCSTVSGTSSTSSSGATTQSPPAPSATGVAVETMSRSNRPSTTTQANMVEV